MLCADLREDNGRMRKGAMKEKWNKKSVRIALTIMILIWGMGTGMVTYGKVKNEVSPTNEYIKENEKSQMEGMLDSLQLEKVDQNMHDLLPFQEESFTTLVNKLISGKLKLNLELIKKIFTMAIIGNYDEIKKTGVTLVMLGLISALFSNFSHIFKNHQIADISFYFLYMLFVLLLLASFQEALKIATLTLEQIILFMKLLIPTFFLAVGFTTATMTAVIFYQFMFVLITIVESILSAVMIPMTSIYVFLSLINGLGEEERFMPIVELIKKAIDGGLKILIAGTTGYGFLQSLITPVIDNVRTTTIQKTLSAIPGIGGIADSAAEVVLGSTILIKNSVGIAFVILLLSICVIPLIHIFVLGMVIKLSAAFIGIVTDKRMTNCANQVGDGTLLILRILFTAISLFVITIAIIVSATSRGM